MLCPRLPLLRPVCVIQGDTEVQGWLVGLIDLFIYGIEPDSNGAAHGYWFDVCSVQDNVGNLGAMLESSEVKILKWDEREVRKCDDAVVAI